MGRDPAGLQIWILSSLIATKLLLYEFKDFKIYISAQKIAFVQIIGSWYRYYCYQEYHLMEQLLQTFTMARPVKKGEIERTVR
jgi:hypothetical protein